MPHTPYASSLVQIMYLITVACFDSCFEDTLHVSHIVLRGLMHQFSLDDVLYAPHSTYVGDAPGLLNVFHVHQPSSTSPASTHWQLSILGIS